MTEIPITKTTMFPGVVIGKSATAFYFFAWLSYLPRLLLKMVRKNFSIRTVRYVENIYDIDRGKMLAQLDNYNDVRDYCLYPEDVLDFTIKDGKLVYGKLRETATYVYQELQSIILSKTNSGQNGTVVEFGSGFGRNCILLKRNAPELDVYGLELSNVSVELSKRAAEKFKTEVKFFQADVTDNLPIGLPKPDVVFSCHALEQMPEIFEAALLNMVNSGAKWIILFEPVEELFPGTQSGMLQKIRIRVNDRMRGLLKGIEKLGLTLSKEYRLKSSINPLNETSVLIIENNLKI